MATTGVFPVARDATFEADRTGASGGRYNLRVAVVHDWLYTYGGAERVLRSILRCLPGADVFTLFDTLCDADRKKIGFSSAQTSFLQRAPGIGRRHRSYLPIMPLAIEQLDLSGYDLVISSSYAVAKGVLTGPDQLHLSYVHSPMRYAWDLQHQYLSDAKLTRGVKGIIARLILHQMRIWDSRTAHGVDAYMVNSRFVGRRVRKIYGREATVIHPPVSLPLVGHTGHDKKDFFLTASRLVTYKNVHAIVEAFRDLPSEKLIVAGDGPELERLKAMAGPNVQFAGFVLDKKLRTLMADARAFVFAAEEDFGIVPLEAQSEGTAVIALGRGGLRETIVSTGPHPTGLFFKEPTPAAISNAIRQFLVDPSRFSAAACQANAQRFSESRFEEEFTAFVYKHVSAFREGDQAAGAAPRLEGARDMVGGELGQAA